MSKQINALKLALEALENTTPTGFNMERDKQFFAAIAAIKEVLANVSTSDTSEKRVDEMTKQRHEPEPVIDKSAAVRIATSLGWTPQRTWVGLTGFEQKELMAMSARDAVFATEAKLRSKNT